MTIVTRIGLDLAKDVFQVRAVDAQDEKVTNKQLKRKDLLQWFAKLERSDDCLVAMEACGQMTSKKGHLNAKRSRKAPLIVIPPFCSG